MTLRPSTRDNGCSGVATVLATFPRVPRGHAAPSLDRMKPTMHEPRRRSTLRPSILALTLLAACASAGGPTPTPGGANAVEVELQRMVDAWNADDLRGHVAAYADSASYTTPRGLEYGRAAITSMLERAFRRGDDLVGTLAFDDVRVRMLGADHALATGAFALTGIEGARDIRGRFTLVFERTAGGWKVIHDHSS